MADFIFLGYIPLVLVYICQPPLSVSTYSGMKAHGVCEIVAQASCMSTPVLSVDVKIVLEVQH